MKKKKIIKKCIAYGCLTALIITHSGPICKKCLHELHNNLHLPRGGMSYDWPVNDYNPGIEITVSGVEIPTNYVKFQ